MTTELVLLSLVRAQLAVSLAIVAVLLLRGVVRRELGPVLGYRLWALPPAALAVSLLPGLAECLNGGVALFSAAPERHTYLAAVSGLSFWRPHGWLLLTAWMSGAGVCALRVAAGELRTRIRAARGLVGPAVIGIAAPRIVVPCEFWEKFSGRERALIWSHERMHIEQGHPIANLIVAAFQAALWFNPLLHVAAVRSRFDQELACDALVLENRPGEQRTYARALIRAHLLQAQPDVSWSLASAWTSKLKRPLQTRLDLLRRGSLSTWRHVTGAVLVTTYTGVVAAVVWSLAPNPQLSAAVRFETSPYPVPQTWPRPVARPG